LTHSKRVSLSIAGTAAVALASLPLGITPTNAARLAQGTTSNIGTAEEEVSLPVLLQQLLDLQGNPEPIKLRLIPTNKQTILFFITNPKPAKHLQLPDLAHL